MSSKRKLSKRYSFEEYVALEQESDICNEFHDGLIIPIGATTNTCQPYLYFFNYPPFCQKKDQILALV